MAASGEASGPGRLADEGIARLGEEGMVVDLILGGELTELRRKLGGGLACELEGVHHGLQEGHGLIHNGFSVAKLPNECFT